MGLSQWICAQFQPDEHVELNRDGLDRFYRQGHTTLSRGGLDTLTGDELELTRAGHEKFVQFKVEDQS